MPVYYGPRPWINEVHLLRATPMDKVYYGPHPWMYEVRTLRAKAIRTFKKHRLVFLLPFIGTMANSPEQHPPLLVPLLPSTSHRRFHKLPTPTYRNYTQEAAAHTHRIFNKPPEQRALRAMPMVQ